MALKAVIAKLEDAPEPDRGHYKKVGNEYHLDAEGLVPKADLDDVNTALTAERAKVEDFRTNNRTLNAQVTDLTKAKEKLAAYDGIDPAEHKRLKAKVDQLEQKGVKGPEDVTALITSALEERIGPLSAKITTLETSLAQKDQQLGEAKLNDLLTREGLANGVDEAMIDDFLGHSRRTWKLVNEHPTAMKDDGVTPLYSAVKATEPMPMKEWLETLKPKKPGYFKPSNGSGANPIPGKPPAAHVRTIPNNPREIGRHAAELASGKVTIATS